LNGVGTKNTGVGAEKKRQKKTERGKIQINNQKGKAGAFGMSNGGGTRKDRKNLIGKVQWGKNLNGNRNNQK